MKYNKIWKRIATTVLTGSMVMGCLVGCGDSKKETQVAESVTTESAVVESVEPTPEPVPEVADLTYWCELQNSKTLLTNLGEMPIIQEASEKTYVNLEFLHPSTTAKEQFNLMMASGDYEDIMEYSWTSYPGGPSQAIADGVIIDLMPYIEEGLAPNFKKILDENPEIAKQITTDEGQIYAFPPIGDASVNVTGGFIFRQDMLDKVGTKSPETIAEWESVLTAFKEQLGVEKPLTGQTKVLIGSTSYLAGAYDTFSGYYVREGKVQYGFMDASYKDYIATMNKWYEAGLIDQEIFGNDSKTVNANLLNDRSGVIYGFIGSGIGTLTNNAAETNPSLKLVGANFPVLEAGQTIRFMPRTWDVRTNYQAAITTKCEDVEAAIRYLDFWYSEEGQLMKNFGTEGVSYNMVNGYPTYTDLILKNPDGHSISNALGGYT